MNKNKLDGRCYLGLRLVGTLCIVLGATSVIADSPLGSFLSMGNQSIPSEITGRVVGGEEANEFKEPWIGSLQVYSIRQNRWNHQCGVSLIDKEWVLTSGICASRVQGIVPSHVRIWMGGA